MQFVSRASRLRRQQQKEDLRHRIVFLLAAQVLQVTFTSQPHRSSGTSSCLLLCSSSGTPQEGSRPLLRACSWWRRSQSTDSLGPHTSSACWTFRSGRAWRTISFGVSHYSRPAVAGYFVQTTSTTTRGHASSSSLQPGARPPNKSCRAPVRTSTHRQCSKRSPRKHPRPGSRVRILCSGFRNSPNGISVRNRDAWQRSSHNHTVWAADVPPYQQAAAIASCVRTVAKFGLPKPPAVDSESGYHAVRTTGVTWFATNCQGSRGDLHPKQPS